MCIRDRLAGVRPPPAAAAMLALGLAPEVVVVPALGAAPPPWRWSRADVAVSLLHHGVYAAAVESSYRRCGACTSCRT